MSDVAAVWTPLSAIQPWDDNPRKNAGRPVATVTELIRTLGWGRPLGVWRGRIVWGHTARLAALALIERWQALTDAQRKKASSGRNAWHSDALRTIHEGVVPVRHRDDLSERQATKLALADNRTNELAEWDMPMLQELLEEFDSSEIAEMGWESDDIDQLAKELLAEADADATIENPADDQSDKAKTDFAVLVKCVDEQEQLHVIAQLEGLGMRCRALV